jgi:hypothetical protein
VFHKLIEAMSNFTYTVANLVVMLRGGYVGVGSGLTGGHCDSRSSILVQLMGMWYPEGSFTVLCPLGVVVGKGAGSDSGAARVGIAMGDTVVD